jgi:protein-arginine kinase activator protein McsA
MAYHKGAAPKRKHRWEVPICPGCNKPNTNFKGLTLLCKSCQHEHEKKVKAVYERERRNRNNRHLI